jgi:predicted nucleotidyltransferase
MAMETARALPDSRLGRLLAAHRDRVLAVASAHGVTNVRVFGSVARGEDGVDSDIDLLVDVPELGFGLIEHAGLLIDLEDELGTSIDVAPSGTLRAGIRDRVLDEAIAL